MPGEEFVLECLADATTLNWFAQLQYNDYTLPLPIQESVYNDDLNRWYLTVATPEPQIFELYDLTVGASNLETDTTANAVRIIPEYRNSYSFIHITDTHLPGHLFYEDPGSASDTTEAADLREVIKDINLINPEFVLLTGDLVNEGELEDFENRRVYTRAQNMLSEFNVPVYLVAGNHDIGGWDDTPPPDGTARRDWWRFFGWEWLQDPPNGDPYYTQNYSFDYGSEHFTGMESYINYDNYMQNIYGDVSFTSGQMQWLNSDLVNSSADNNIVFYHMDFDDEIFLDNMGIDMVLYGHVHSDNGSIYDPPFNLSTEATCDGERAYRVINVNNGTLEPQYTISAGNNGDNLSIEYFPDNHGTSDSVLVIIENQHSLDFQEALVKFKMPPGESNFMVNIGEILQVYRSIDLCMVYVSVNIPANDELAVILTTMPVNSENDVIPDFDMKLQNYPNPFNPETTISFSLTANDAKSAKLYIYNVKGQKVKTLFINSHPEPVEESGHNSGTPSPSIELRMTQAGSSKYSVTWNGTDDNDQPVSSGLYFYKLKTKTKELTKKMLLLR
ncbi:metallophosphoesterase [Candidatus Cloacimonadota bacterium]